MGKKKKRAKGTENSPVSIAPAEVAEVAADADVRTAEPVAEAAAAELPSEPPVPESVSSGVAVVEDESPADSAPESTAEGPASVAPPSSGSAEGATPKKKRKKRVTKRPPAPAITREAMDEKIDRLEAKLEVKKEEAAKAAREGFGSNPAIDDTSVPPVDLEVHDEFFAAGDQPSATAKEGGAFEDGLDARHAQKMTAAAHARRAHLSRYVKWAVGGAGALLLVALTVGHFRHPDNEPVRREVTHVAAAVEPPPQPTQAPIDSPPPVEVAKADPKDDTDDNPKNDPKNVDDAKKPEPEAPAVKKPAEMAAEGAKTAYQEKQSAKAALERGANGVAIAAGERSVALDPSDGEAWLVLGGAYQAMGNNAQAKRCYKTCVAQGKKGPTSDCRDMLNSL